MQACANAEVTRGMAEMRNWVPVLAPLLWLPLERLETRVNKAVALIEYNDPLRPVFKRLARVLPTDARAQMLLALLQGFQARRAVMRTGDEASQMRVAASYMVATAFANTDAALLVPGLRELVRDLVLSNDDGYATWTKLSADLDPAATHIKLHASALSCLGTLVRHLDDPALDAALLQRLLDNVAACAGCDEAMPSVLQACLTTTLTWATDGRLSAPTALSLVQALSALGPKLLEVDGTTGLRGDYFEMHEELRETLLALRPIMSADQLMDSQVKSFFDQYTAPPKQMAGQENMESGDTVEEEEDAAEDTDV